MRASHASLLASAIALAVLSADARAEDAKPPESPTWYAQTHSRSDEGNLNVTNFWSKGPWLRAETVVVGRKVVTIVRGEWYYAYDAISKRGIAIRREPAAIAKDGGRPFANEYETLIEQGAEIIGEAPFRGNPTGILRVTDDYGQRELWVTLDDDHLPLHLEVYDRRTSRRRVTEYVTWQRGVTLVDSFFEPHPDTELERMDVTAYMQKSLEQGTVPVLYADLLRVRRSE